MSITREQFLAQRAPRRGTANPERMDMPVWAWLVGEACCAYAANQKFEGASPFEAGPGWCFDRFGMSRTTLPDGRTVNVAGEHEDHYDPDFYIYNDVVVRHPGGRVEIFGYPEDVFPPTDFHSATLVGERIVLVGSLGYPDRRKPGKTQVALLDLADFSLQLVETKGEGPGWIHDHRARLAEDEAAIVITRGQIQPGEDGRLVENFDDWALALETWTWRRLMERPHQQWEVRREDGEALDLFACSCLSWEEQYPEFAEEPDPESPIPTSRETIAERGFAWDVELYQSLYVPDIPHEPLEQELDRDEEGRTPRMEAARIRVGGALVRYIDETFAVLVIVEGELPEETVRALLDDFSAKLARLQNASFVSERL